MKRLMRLSVAVLFVATSLGATGCGLHRLKDDNQRLKESNDRLISENNRLEEQLASMQRRMEDLDAAPAPAAGSVAATGMTPAAATGIVETGLLPGFEDMGITVATNPRGDVRIRIPEQVFFGLGQTSLSTRGQATLDRVAGIIKDTYPGRTVRVDGHTDDIPINRLKARYPTNWELSTARACEVVRYLVERGIDRQKIFAAGFGEFHPVVYGKTAAARSKNRRVEITVLNDTAF